MGKESEFRARVHRRWRLCDSIYIITANVFRLKTSLDLTGCTAATLHSGESRHLSLRFRVDSAMGCDNQDQLSGGSIL